MCYPVFAKELKWNIFPLGIHPTPFFPSLSMAGEGSRTVPSVPLLHPLVSFSSGRTINFWSGSFGSQPGLSLATSLSQNAANYIFEGIWSQKNNGDGLDE